MLDVRRTQRPGKPIPRRLVLGCRRDRDGMPVAFETDASVRPVIPTPQMSTFISGAVQEERRSIARHDFVPGPSQERRLPIAESTWHSGDVRHGSTGTHRRFALPERTDSAHFSVISK
jgi:hypothetical protein